MFFILKLLHAVAKSVCTFAIYTDLFTLSIIQIRNLLSNSVKAVAVRKLAKLTYHREKLKSAQNDHFSLCSFHEGVSKRPLLSSP